MVRPLIEEVFTPRNRAVNDEMYVARPDLEQSLLRAMRGSKHAMLFGESGNGKSWLYKHLFAKERIPYIVANCGNAGRLGTLTEEIYKCCLPSGHLTKTGVEDTKEAVIKAPIIAEAKINSINKYDRLNDEPLLAAFRYLSSKNSRTVLVIENLEAILDDQKLIDELCNIILLVDDDRYAECNVKLLIVGTPNGVVDFFGRSRNLQSISNRITEVSKVSGLSPEQVGQLIKLGFEKLSIRITPEESLSLKNYVVYMTLGIAQRVHELCSAIAYCAEVDNWMFSKSLFTPASQDWLGGSLRASYVVVESHLNSIETTVGRRNQVIFSIGLLNRSPFVSSEIEALIRREFPDTIPETNMGIGSILSELCEPGNPLLKKGDKLNYYNLLDPLHVMTIRLILKKDPITKKVVKRTFKRT
jgi:hypothetical protein